MTLDEKCGQLSCPIGFNFYEKEGDSLWLSESFKGMMDTLPLGSCYGVLRADPWSQKTVETGLKPAQAAIMLNDMQRYAIENTRLGIPLLFCEEAPHGHMAIGTTVFPTGIAQASTWNPKLLEKWVRLWARKSDCKAHKWVMVQSWTLPVTHVGRGWRKPWVKIHILLVLLVLPL